LLQGFAGHHKGQLYEALHGVLTVYGTSTLDFALVLHEIYQIFTAEMVLDISITFL
jgi:hypothetical protein